MQLTCDVVIIEITPVYAQISFDSCVRIGAVLAIQVGFPTIHGAGVIGIQADGAPSAAITAGLSGLLQDPNGKIFIKGLLSRIFATGRLLIMILLSGNTPNGIGAVPNEH